MQIVMEKQRVADLAVDEAALKERIITQRMKMGGLSAATAQDLKVTAPTS